MKIYLAGPDIFRPDVDDWIANARELCRQHGFEALTPFDHGETEPRKILNGNLELIRKAQIVVANLNPFRGFEPDSGTAWEIGFALALGKPVVAYLADVRPLAEKLSAATAVSGPSAPQPRDPNGFLIEDFGLPVNLMLAVPCRIVAGGLAEALAVVDGLPSLSRPVE